MVVFPDRAQVTRVVEVDVQAGVNAIAFRDLPPTVDERTIAADGEGIEGARLLGLDVQRRELAEDRRARVSELQGRIEALGDEIRALQDAQQAARIELQFLESLRVASASQASAELLFADQTVRHAAGMADLLEERVPEVQERLREAEFAAREKSEQLSALQRELSTVQGSAQWARRDVIVQLESPSAGKATVELSYVLPGASWTAAYDVRARPDDGKLDLTLNALVTQTSGEDWTDVALSLSTARPSGGVTPPVLDPYWLQSYVPPPPVYYGYDDDLAGAAMDEGDAEEESERSKKAEAPPAPPPPPPMAHATATVSERAIATTFEVPSKSTVAGDGTRRKIRVVELDLDVDYLHVAVPRYEEAAFLVASGKWTQGWPLLPGEVASFLDDSFVGTSRTELVGTGSEFEFPFGKDDAVKVERVVVSDRISNPDWLGKVTRELGYRYTVQNARKKAVNVEIRDRIPVSTEDRYKVRYEGDEPDERTTEGLITFVRTIEAGGNASVGVTWVVRYPRRYPPGNLE